MKLFYEQECRLQILPHAIFCTFISYSPLFCTAFLFSSNVPTLYPLTLSSLRPSAVFHFFVAASISLFTCLRNRIPLSVFMLSYSRKVSKQCI